MSDQNKPFPAYVGSDPYIFVCYAHRKSDSVYADIAELHRNGINIWYDEGIPAGNSWRGEIAAAIKGASKFLFFISNESLQSSHCLREVDYALTHNVEILPIYLEKLVLPDELELALNRVQALFRHDDARYMERLLGAIEGSSGMRPLVADRSRKSIFPRSVGIVGVAAIALLIGIVLAWRIDPGSTVSNETSQATSGASGYDRYLDGLKLMERWDKTDNIEQAINFYTEAIELEPDFALAYARLADAQRIRYMLRRDEDALREAKSMADKALQLNPDLAPVQIALGHIYAIEGNTDLAFAAFEKALSIDRNDPMANEALGSLYKQMGRIEDAESAYRKAVSLDPENLDVRNSYADFLYSQSRFAESAEQWQKMIRLAPDHYAGLVNLGAALTETGKTAEAITMYERAIEIQPTYMAYSNLGHTNAGAGLYDVAIDAYKKAIELQADDWLAWGNMAYAYSSKGDAQEESLRAFQRAIELAEAARNSRLRDPYVNSDLALYYAKTGHNELAVERLQTALALAPDHGDIHGAAAEVYELLNQRDQAIEHLVYAIELRLPWQRLFRNRDLADLLSDPRVQALR